MLLTILRQTTGAEWPFIIVDDGSGAQYMHIFESARTKFGCRVLTHAVNLGKGRALKTAFNDVLNEFPECIGVVTVDADGQHAVEDIMSCARELEGYPSHLILGCRRFEDESVPLKNGLGNKLTRWVLNALCGISISDTQTGLRGIPRQFLKRLLTVPGERFEFEMNVILECLDCDTKIKEIPIQTIYAVENRTSHFRPILDSARIYKVFIKYSYSALLSFAIDISLFSIFTVLLRSVYPLHYIAASTALARIVSSVLNHLFNRNMVFKSKTSKTSIIKYYLLATVQMAASAWAVTHMFSLFPVMGETVTKMFVDTALFFISFYLQRVWVFLK